MEIDIPRNQTGDQPDPAVLRRVAVLVDAATQGDGRAIEGLRRLRNAAVASARPSVESHLLMTAWRLVSSCVDLSTQWQRVLNDVRELARHGIGLDPDTLRDRVFRELPANEVESALNELLTHFSPPPSPLRANELDPVHGYIRHFGRTSAKDMLEAIMALVDVAEGVWTPNVAVSALSDLGGWTSDSPRPYNVVGNMLGALEKEGAVTKEGRGEYRITQAARERHRQRFRRWRVKNASTWGDLAGSDPGVAQADQGFPE